ncbi:TIGR04211 family SH3 domain-containing protein [Shewanella sp. 202IG2-18]|uniref:TIGR04211 family SH3 domain-containing protein n=1 Tax=Parashewanella hymeniacidonis TaxID=2807618 RepID=UPI00195FFC23|nr:TIGR04211 family SH3 domain-containing protein [Parashewanella hymeniacidonis]
MLKKLALSLCFLVLPFQLQAEETRYISENVYVYLHSGPGSQYKILGSVAAGRKVTLLPEAQGGFSKVIDNKGREGWIQSKMIVKDPTFRITEPKLQQQIDDLQKELTTVKAVSALSSQNTSELEQQLAAAIQARKTAESSLATVQQQLLTANQDEKYRFWREGGMIAGVGLLIGLILAYFPKPGRKRKTSW